MPIQSGPERGSQRLAGGLPGGRTLIFKRQNTDFQEWDIITAPFTCLVLLPQRPNPETELDKTGLLLSQAANCAGNLKKIGCPQFGSRSLP